MEYVSREADGRTIDEGGRRGGSRSESPYRPRQRSRSPSYGGRSVSRSPVRCACCYCLTCSIKFLTT